MCGINPPEDTKHPVEGKKTMSLFKRGSVCGDLAESDFTTCGKERVLRGWKPGALWRRVLMPGWDTVTGQCFQSRRQDPCQTATCLWKCLCPALGSWANLRALSELPNCPYRLLRNFFSPPPTTPTPICGASGSDGMIAYWCVYLDASELFKVIFYETWLQICFLRNSEHV